MHRQEYNTLFDIGRILCFHSNDALFAFNLYQVIILDTTLFRITRMYFQESFTDMLVQLIYLAGFAHGMPLVAYAARGEYKRLIIAWLLTDIFVTKRVNDGFL